MDQRTWGIIGGAVLIVALLSPLFLGNFKSVETLYEDAELLFKHRKYEDAIKKYNKAIKVSKKPGSNSEQIHKHFPAFANYKIALCYEKLGDTKKNIKYYTQAERHIRRTLTETDYYQLKEKLHFLLANILIKTDKPREAEAQFSYFIKIFPNSIFVEDALFHIGSLNKKLHLLNESQAAFQRIIDEFPTSKYRREAEYTIAQLLVSKQNGSNNLNKPNLQENARDNNSIDKTTTELISPEDAIAESIYKTAIECLKRGDHYDANQLFTTILKEFPNGKYTSFAHEGIGDIYFESENYVKARQKYEQAIYSTTDQERRQELYQKKQQTFLVADYVDVIPDPIPQSDLFTKAILLHQEGKFTEAAQIYEKLSKSDIPEDDLSFALYRAGVCYYRESKGDLELFNKAAELFVRFKNDHSARPEIAQVYYYLASTYFEWGNAFDDDISKYQLAIQAINEAKGNPLVNDSSKQIWFNRLAELEKNVKRKMYPNPNPSPDPIIPVTIHYNQGLDFLDEKRYDNAIDEFEKCLYHDPDFQKAYCNLGVIYFRKKDYQLAINLLEDAVAIDSNFKEAYFNLGLAYLKLNKIEDAKTAAENALRIDPNYENAKILIDSITD